MGGGPHGRREDVANVGRAARADGWISTTRRREFVPSLKVARWSDDKAPWIGGGWSVERFRGWFQRVATDRKDPGSPA